MTQQQVQAIRVRGLEKSYELHVLRGVDFDVARGSIFALLGSNGAGKTTAAKILSTRLRADDGAASINGFDVAPQPANVREAISTVLLSTIPISSSPASSATARQKPASSLPPGIRTSSCTRHMTASCWQPQKRGSRP